LLATKSILDSAWITHERAGRKSKRPVNSLSDRVLVWPFELQRGGPNNPAIA